MIELKLQIILIIISIIMTSYIIYLIRKEVLELKYSLFWIIIGIILLVISIFPGIIEFIARIMGIGLPVNALFLIGILFIIVILITQTVAISKAHVKITRLTQEIGILKMKKYKNKN
jgi:hypothetical protein